MVYGRQYNKSRKDGDRKEKEERKNERRNHRIMGNGIKDGWERNALKERNKFTEDKHQIL